MIKAVKWNRESTTIGGLVEKLYRISVTCQGVKKRCRKTERHYLKMGYIPYNDGVFNQAEIEAQARDFIATNMKSIIGKPKVSLSFTERKKDDYGTIETFQLFDSRNIDFVLNSALENELN